MFLFSEEGKIVINQDGQPAHLAETTTIASTSQVLQYAQGFHEWKAPLRKMKQTWLNHPLNLDEEPRCFIRPMASGMAVRSDNPFPWLREHSNRNVLGLDMEAASFYRALGTFSHIHALVVKGVSDYGDHTKHDQFHFFAARASAVYLLYFIQEYVTVPDEKEAASNDDDCKEALCSLDTIQIIDLRHHPACSKALSCPGNVISRLITNQSFKRSP